MNQGQINHKQVDRNRIDSVDVKQLPKVSSISEKLTTSLLCPTSEVGLNPARCPTVSNREKLIQRSQGNSANWGSEGLGEGLMLKTDPAEISEIPEPDELGSSDESGRQDLPGMKIAEMLVEEVCKLSMDFPIARPIQINGYFLHLWATDSKPRGQIQNIPFSWSPINARRILGIQAARSIIDGQCNTPKEAVAGIVKESITTCTSGSVYTGSLSRWLASLSMGGLSSVMAEAITWTSRFITALDWSSIPQTVEIGRDYWWNCQKVPLITLRGRSDVRVRIPLPIPLKRDQLTGKKTAQKKSTEQSSITGGSLIDKGVAFFTVMADNSYLDCRSELGLPALVEVLRRPYAPLPLRVVGWWPNSGRSIVLPVTDQLLEETAKSVIDAVRNFFQSASFGNNASNKHNSMGSFPWGFDEEHTNPVENGQERNSSMAA